MRFSLTLLAVACWSAASGADLQPVDAGTKLSAVWANQGGDKVTQDELRKSRGVGKTVNSLWNGQAISLLGAQNEVVDFNLVLEAANAQATNVRVTFNALSDGAGHAITSRTSSGGDDVFNWVGRPIELFLVRYLQINGLSQLDYQTYDERQIPKRFQRPWTGEGVGTGGWTDRPDHNKYYPDIAVPIELSPTFAVAAGTNQSVWGDIYIPKGTPAGVYSGTIAVSEGGTVTWQVPVRLRVASFALPDTPSAKTMISYDESVLNNELLGQTYVDSDSTLRPRGTTIRDRFHMLAHRHRVSLIGEAPTTGNTLPPMDQPAPESVPRLNGSLFTAAHGYDGPGVNTGIGVYSIGNYGTWASSWGTSQSAIWTHTDNWVNWFDANDPGVDYFLYLIDESSNYAQTDGWAQTIKANPGSGHRMPSMATVGTLHIPSIPDVTLPNSPAGSLCVASQGEQITSAVIDDPSRRLWQYNCQRPATGSFATEDDGVSPRQLAWCQYKKRIARWFYWDATVWDVNTDVFKEARTWGSYTSDDPVLGRTGYSYDNGNGVLVYPGRQTRFPGDSYDVDGLFASLRLKHWRRGIEDVDYLTLAAKINPTQVQAIVDQMVPKVLWEIGCSDPNDPTWILCDISWQIDPDAWESARAQLAAIIDPSVAGGSSSTPSTIAPPPPTTTTTRSPYGGTPAAIPGRIEAENFDDGGEGVAYHDLDATNDGGAYRATGVDIRATLDAGGGYQVGWYGAGEWMEYTVNVAATGDYDLSARVSEGGAGATIHIAFDGVDMTGPMAIPGTGSYDAFTDVVRPGVRLTAGQHVMRIACDASNLDINYVAVSATPRGPFGGTARAIPGTIQAEDFDEGGEGVAYHDSDVTNNGGAYRATSVDIRASVDAGGGYQVGWFGAGEWMQYTVNVAAAGAYDIGVRAAEGDSAATIHVAIDGVDQTGPMAVTNTGDYDTFQTFTRTGVTLSAGTHVVRLACDAANVDVNWIAFTAAKPQTGIIGANVLLNPGFEADGRDTQTPTAWGEWGGSTGVDLDASYAEAYGGAHSGGWHGTHWKPAPYEVYTWQQPSGLANGIYELSAWVKGGGGQTYAWMEAKDYGGAKVTANVPTTSTWTRIAIPGIVVTSGRCTVGFYSKAAAYQWIYFDDVQLARTDVVVAGVTYKLVAKHSGKCLDVSNASTVAGANVQQWSDNGTTAQRWRIDAVGDGSYTLKAACSGDLLDVAGSSLIDGGNVLQWPSTGNPNQRWKLDDISGGWFRLTNVNSGKVLDVAGVSTIDGANVQQWTWVGGDNQQWAIVPVAPTSTTTTTAADPVMTTATSGGAGAAVGGSGGGHGGCGHGSGYLVAAAVAMALRRAFWRGRDERAIG